jgi:hypothetical protein
MSFLAFSAEPGSDWELYGSVRLNAAQWQRGHWYRHPLDSNGVMDTTSDDYDYDTLPIERFMYDMQFNSRFGARYKKERLGFRFEAGWGYVLRDYKAKLEGVDLHTSQRVKDAMILRRLYGEWFINDYFTLLIGHEWNIANFLTSSQVFDMEQGLGYCGALCTGRKPQVRFIYNHVLEPINWKAEFAVAKTDTFITWTQADGTEEAEELMPKLEGGVSFGFSSEIFDANAQIIAGTTRYRQRNNRALLEDDVVSKIKTECYAFLVDFRIWKFKANVQGAMGTNLAAYGVYMGDPEGFRQDLDMLIFYPSWGFKDKQAQDSLWYSITAPFIKQGCMIVNFKPFPWIAAEWGGGLIDVESGDLQIIEGASNVPNVFRRFAWYANIQFSFLDDHIFIVPEYSTSDFGGGRKGQDQFGTGGVWKAWSCKVQMDI